MASSDTGAAGSNEDVFKRLCLEDAIRPPFEVVATRFFEPLRALKPGIMPLWTRSTLRRTIISFRGP